MNSIILSKETTKGWFDEYQFGKAIDNGQMCASHYMKNKRATYVRNLGTKWFNSADEGNDFYKKLRAQGYTKK